MRNRIQMAVRVACGLLVIIACGVKAGALQHNEDHATGIALQGGAGVILRENLSPELEAEYRAKLTEALLAGNDVLQRGGSSLDAVVATIVVLEDSPLFNAGKGAVFTHEGTNELDASIMEGKTLGAGAVSGVKHIKNPISLARLVMERSPHVMMTGEGAEAFAVEEHVPLVDTKYFYTEKRWKQLQEILAREKKAADSSRGKKFNAVPISGPEGRYGTVGCVALDKAGNLAAGTSTGGLTNKRFGRVGDAPIIGAGTYANNATCAVSATGDGEFFIRSAFAHDVSTLMEFKGMSVKDAAATAIERMAKLGGTGGAVAIDRNGTIAMPFNSPGMYRAYIGADGKPVVQIFKE